MGRSPSCRKLMDDRIRLARKVAEIPFFVVSVIVVMDYERRIAIADFLEFEAWEQAAIFANISDRN
jgi:hypothetical protein